MASPDGELTVAQRLGRALDRGLLPAGGPAEAAERLIERLERPARIALLGLPGSGKSSILNLLVGTVVVPETLRLPTIIVQHGDVSRMICTLTDGTTNILPGSDLGQVLPLAPALVTLEMDLPALRVISLLEVSAGPMEAEQKRAATWASKRADIVIWCTTSYLPKEQAVWESLPDAVKDNSFMLLTKVDLLGSRESAQAMHQRVELRAGEEFRQILSISAKQARQAMPPGGTVNRDLFRDSGAGAVITAIKTRVQSGRRADTDMAELLLARHVEASELVAKRFAEAEEAEAPRQWTPPPEPEAVPAPSAPSEPSAAEPPAPVPVEAEPVAEKPVLDDSPEPSEPEAEITAEPAPAAKVPDPIPDVVEPVAEAAPVIEAAPVAEAAPAPAPEPEQPTTRRRFADRIKRVAGDAEKGAAPAVPLRTTWKSKAETEAAAAPAPEPEPAPRPAEAARRPRVSQPVKEEPLAEAVAEPDVPAPAEDVAPVPDLAEPEPVVAAAVEDEPVLPAPILSEAEDAEPTDDEPVEVPPVVPDSPRPARERPARAVTPRPDPAATPVRTARPNLFGKRAGDSGGTPLPDLSALRATQEEMEAALAAAEEDQVPEVEVEVEEDEPVPPAPESPIEPVEAEPAPVAPVARAAAPTDRPRLFERARPAAPDPALSPRAEPAPRATPISRSPAPPRMPAPAEVPTPAAASAMDDAQFSPRAIMRRESTVEAAAAPPRRERTRIAARAVPAAPAAATTAQVSSAEQDIVEEAVRLIVARTAELEQVFDPDSKVPVDLILDHSRETSEQVIAIVSRGKSEALRRISSDLGEVMDLIMLMQLEKGHAPADDALTMILQLKRELETLSAA